jgi:superfamily I DNA/RNA helicase
VADKVSKKFSRSKSSQIEKGRLRGCNMKRQLEDSSFNDSQHQAVFHNVQTGLIVVAPPGSGKTFSMIARVLHLLESGIRAHEILCLTFTNKAANEMRERLSRLTSEPVTLTTFHSFCLRLCRAENFVQRNSTVWGDTETKKALKQILTARLKREDSNADCR